MKLSAEIIKEYESVKEYGDLLKLMRLVKIKSHSHISRIMSGDNSTTISNVAKIIKFISNRKKVLNELTEDLN